MLQDKSDKSRWNAPCGASTRMQNLIQRHTILNTIREDLNSQGFVEIETPLVVKSTCPDLYIDSMHADGGYLATSTEYQIKRMIVGGFDKVYTLTKNFRAEDNGRYHSSEFTMLEWARPHGTLQTIEEDTVRFIRKVFTKLYPGIISIQTPTGQEIDFISKEWESISVREAFKKYMQMDELEDFSLQPLLRSAQKAHIDIPTWCQAEATVLISYLMDQLQCHLGQGTPTFLQEWPAYLTTSAPPSLKDPYAAERTELYIGGIEIANGFPFLTDATLQEKLFQEKLEMRQQAGKEPVLIDARLIAALKEGMPSGAGMALGIDRLVMLLVGATRIADVQAFSWDEL